MHRELFPFSGFGMLNWVISTVQKGSVFVKVHMETFWCYPDFSTTCKSNQNSAKFPKILKKRRNAKRYFWTNHFRKQVVNPGVNTYFCKLVFLV